MKTSFQPAAIILAAGYSSRMGAFKPLLPIGGLPAVVRLIRQFRKAGIEEIGVVTGYLRDKLKPVIEAEGATEIYNSEYDRGMFSSVLSGIRHFSKTAQGVFLAPVDCPLIPAEVVKQMLSLAKSERNRFIVPIYRGKKGHPLWIPSNFFYEIETHNGDMGLKGITSKYEPGMIRLDTHLEGIVLDMDTPEAYEKLLSFYEKGSNTGEFLKLAEDRRFILIRHGRTVRHREKIFMGQYDPPLDEEGSAQAIGASKELKKYDPKADILYTSDLKRASRTAELISQGLGGIKLCTLPGLREISLGAWDGRYISDIKSRYPDEYEKRGKNLLTYKPDTKAENFYDLQYRVLDCVSDILRQDENPDIIIVTHSGVIKVLYGNLMDKDIQWAMDRLNPTNGSVTVIDQSANKGR
ncbi:MAG: NTP transferase domain-containing protein [Clostridiales bacterium]|jgi:molybdenum cofactor cytidylyltransferase|nr:NTP transferase domain-containing protein [Clostridiales bacterium]